MDEPAKSAAPSICQLPCPSCPFCLINLKSNPSLAPLSHPASALLFGSVSFPPFTMQSCPSLAHSLTMAPQCPWKEAQDFLHNTQDPARISSLLSRSDSVLTLNRTPFAKGPVLCLACQLLICTCYSLYLECTYLPTPIALCLASCSFRKPVGLPHTSPAHSGSSLRTLSPRASAGAVLVTTVPT